MTRGFKSLLVPWELGSLRSYMYVKYRVPDRLYDHIALYIVTSGDREILIGPRFEHVHTLVFLLGLHCGSESLYS